MADRDPVLTVDKNCQRHFSQMAPSKPRMAPDSSKESAPATFTLALSNLPFSPDNPHLLTF
jgi:hypothetical protein